MPTRKPRARKVDAGRSPVLNPRQQRFVHEYLIDLNATQAAIRAGYSERTAEQQGPRLLGVVGVKSAIDGALAKRAARSEVKSDAVLQEVARLAFSDVRMLFDASGNLLQAHQLGDNIAPAVASIEVVTRSIGDGEVEYVHKIKLWDKPKALEQLMRHLGMLTDRVKLDLGEAVVAVRVVDG